MIDHRKTLSLAIVMAGTIATSASAAAQPARVLANARTAVARVSEANRAALREPVASHFTNAKQVYGWSEGAVYRLFAAPGRISDVVLQPGEKLVSVAAGDTSRWIVGDTMSGSGAEAQVHILVKPVEAGLRTNMVITTDRRTYHLELDSRPLLAMSAIGWTYPADQLLAIKQREVAVEGKPASETRDLTALNFDYEISGDTPAWRPVRAFDDGRQTFIEFPRTLGQSEAPPLFLVGPDGSARLVNYRVNGRHYVVDRLFGAAELRLGEKRQMVVRIKRGTVGAPEDRRSRS